jgi:hypothetical protein
VSQNAVMPDEETQQKVKVAGHVIGRGRLRVEGTHLVVTFTVTGPHASPRFPKEHVILIRPGDPEKLNSLGGHGGQDAEDQAFFEWKFDWPGGTAVEVVYFDDGNQVAHREHVVL